MWLVSFGHSLDIFVENSWQQRQLLQQQQSQQQRTAVSSRREGLPSVTLAERRRSSTRMRTLTKTRAVDKARNLSDTNRRGTEARKLSQWLLRRLSSSPPTPPPTLQPPAPHSHPPSGGFRFYCVGGGAPRISLGRREFQGSATFTNLVN